MSRCKIALIAFALGIVTSGFSEAARGQGDTFFNGCGRLVFQEPGCVFLDPDAGGYPDPLGRLGPDGWGRFVVGDRIRASGNVVGCASVCNGYDCLTADSVIGPCIPTCEILSPDNCQLIDDTIDVLTAPSDLSAPGGALVRADDFVPVDAQLTSVCTWGAYLDYAAPSPSGSFDCVSVATDTEGNSTDKFLITVYADAGGYPGTMVGQSAVSRENVGRTIRQDSYYHAENPAEHGELYAYALTLDEPITLENPGTCHWLEIANDTSNSEVEEPNHCIWAQQTVTTTGNAHSATAAWDEATGRGAYTSKGLKTIDLAWCVNCGRSGDGCGETPEGSCCDDPLTEGGVCRGTTFAGCASTKDRFDITSPASCEGVECPTTGSEGDVCVTDAIEATGDHVWFEFDTGFATTDGPPKVGYGFPIKKFGSDIWIKYTASCQGKIQASLCSVESLWDSYISLHHDPANPTECICPFEADGVTPIEGGAPQAGMASDEGCNGIGDGGAGWVESVTHLGDCWLVRVGGYGFDKGPGRVDIKCVPPVCYQAAPPFLETIDVQGAHGRSEPIVVLKNRVISVSQNSLDAGRTQAIRVTFVTLPEPYDVWNGTELWVGETAVVSDNGASIPGIVGFDIHTIAPLQCTGPVYKDWTSLAAGPVVHIYHEGIVPGGLYHVQMLDETCSVTFEGFYSDVLEVTNPVFGDVLRDLSYFPHGVPDGEVSILDIKGIVERFISAPGGISKPRAEMEPPCLDWQTNVGDWLVGVNAFQGWPYTPVPTHASDPCGSLCRAVHP